MDDPIHEGSIMLEFYRVTNGTETPHVISPMETLDPSMSTRWSMIPPIDRATVLFPLLSLVEMDRTIS